MPKVTLSVKYGFSDFFVVIAKLLSTLFTDTAIGGDIIHFDLIDELSVDYIISFSHKKEDLYKNKF